MARGLLAKDHWEDSMPRSKKKKVDESVDMMFPTAGVNYRCQFSGGRKLLPRQEAKQFIFGAF
jgi:hypothetical protein